MYINIPEEEGTEIVLKTYDSFHNYNPPIPTRFLREMLGTHGTAMGTKMVVSFANISWLKLKQRQYNEAKSSLKNGDEILTISCPSGTVIKKTSIILLNKLTNSTVPLNSRPKYQ